MQNLFKVFLVLLVVFVGNNSALALPEYQMKYQQSCALCHVNPNGGGMRTLYGAQFFSQTDLAMHNLEFDQLDKFNPQVTDQLQIGFDFRFLYYAVDSSTDVNYNDDGFITMQSDLYANFQLSQQSFLHASFGRGGSKTGYALFSGLPLNGMVRVGRFTPAYGWAYADHRNFNRRFTGYGSLTGAGPRAYDSGIELGFYPDSWTASVGLFNGIAQNGKAIVGRFAKRLSLSNFNMTLGVSSRYEELFASYKGDMHHGVFYGLQFNRFTILSEYDYIIESSKGYLASNLLRMDIVQGIYANALYEFYDPDKDFKSGDYARARFYMDIIPNGYFNISPGVEWNRDLNKDEFLSAEVQFHLWY